MFILKAQRDADDWEDVSWKRYPAYLESVRDRMPASAYALATSDWYFGFSDPRGPHDARLVEVAIGEGAAAPDRFPTAPPSLRIRLLNAWGNGYIELRYPRVYRYQLTMGDGGAGHRDWLFDEFRLTDDGHVLHEIEWWGSDEAGRWIIEASDVEHAYLPVNPNAEG
jgi:hypothetical protein